ncbi:MAG: dihydroorotase [Candidatus Cloacimonadota bacterium]|nr:MAG: dihydroorotase [Candidatus Cloacimonadota bacterium]PIE77914.1 MAG: dihydroorotase [Candidatus Delongbacteria bacterium]
MFNNLTLTKPEYKNLPVKVLIKNGKIVDPVNGINEIKDIKIIDGVIEEIATKIAVEDDTLVINAEGKYISQGFFDMHVHFRDPGIEQAENIVSGSNAAMAGGFTGVAMMPNTEPCIDNKFLFNDLVSRSKDFLVDCHPIPAITVGRKGEKITEMAELVETGALGFTDDGSGVQSSESSRRALEYSKMFDVPIMVHAQDTSFEPGVMNEGFYSTLLGMAGISNLTEDLMISRDIHIAEYTGGKLHIQHISTKKGVELVRDAKKRGLKVTAEVTPHHFSLTDEKVTTFSTDFKMAPPLRAEDDLKAVLEGLKDGTIDAIATDHAPHTPEKKNVEFDFAPFGVIGLETSFAAGNSNLVKKGILTIESLIEKMAVNPRKILKLDYDLIKVGNKANLTIFDTETEFVVDRFKMKSLSRNTAFNGETLFGKVYHTINNGKIFSAE